MMINRRMYISYAGKSEFVVYFMALIRVLT